MPICSYHSIERWTFSRWLPHVGSLVETVYLVGEEKIIPPQNFPTITFVLSLQSAHNVQAGFFL